MTRRRAPLLLLMPLLLVLVLAGCGTAATPTPTPTPTPVPTPTPAPPTATPGPGQTPTFPLPSFTADKDLEALLPDELGGVPLTKASMSGPDLIEGGTLDPETQAFLDRVGATIEDVSIAYATDQTGTIDVTPAAVRVKGADSARLTQAFIATSEADGSEVTDGTVAGKAVKIVTDPSGTSPTQFVWVRGDIVFVVSLVSGENPALVEEAIFKMP